MQSNIPMPDHIRATYQPMQPKPPTECPASRPLTNAEIRANFLEQVQKLVCTDRNMTHGDAEDNFRVIAELWNIYIKNSPGDNCNDLSNKDVAIMMCLFKISRLMSNVNNMENWLDLAGYATCGGGIVKKQVE